MPQGPRARSLQGPGPGSFLGGLHLGKNLGPSRREGGLQGGPWARQGQGVVWAGVAPGPWAESHVCCRAARGQQRQGRGQRGRHLAAVSSTTKVQRPNVRTKRVEEAVEQEEGEDLRCLRVQTPSPLSSLTDDSDVLTVTKQQSHRQ